MRRRPLFFSADNDLTVSSIAGQSDRFVFPLSPPGDRQKQRVCACGGPDRTFAASDISLQDVHIRELGSLSAGLASHAAAAAKERISRPRILSN
jgi:hypothetical protein